jgi:DNA-binding response OmpR family regulator
VKILIVEDDTKVALFLTHLIEKWGYQTDIAETGEDAVRKVTEKNFDMILLDVYLPDTDAFELIPRLARVCPKPKIVAMTGYGTEELEREIRKLGVLHYIPKPVKINEFKTLLKHIAGFFHLTGTQSG